MRKRTLAALALAMLAGCRSTASPSPALARESSDGPRSAETAAPPTTGDDVAPPPTAAGEDPTTKPTAAAFPAVDRSCVRDDDCDTHHRYLTDDGRCCYTCDHRIGNRSWVREVMKICETRSRAGCPMKKCKAPPELACLDGSCRVAPAPP